MKKFEHIKLKKEDFSFFYTHYSYMITYKGIKIGGSGSDKSAKRNSSNLAYYKQQAQITIRSIVEEGRCAMYMQNNINNINIDELNQD